ncbi:hypothetical protein K461DRAFT_312121 [Myriangium duriaei CBS 260.36]|uniref:Thiamine-triphosphatase n=1 Tax=Myriangium duriaei CBS 260.36 TaxID=1168546 RepID=A0A9P4J408_9PEZI|nr:hypothetical protein K461DRAFT_312121 [Myriangium duriaei CBS 260.36]
MAKNNALSTVSCILEVERKFAGLAIKDLTTNIGHPPFRSVTFCGQRTIRDTYYDTRSRLLSSAGIWVRQRDGKWEAKVKQGGDFINSRFEEVSDVHAIIEHIRKVTEVTHDERQHFGLEQMAAMCTTRRAWLANTVFSIVEDRTDFGHVVGEVELHRELIFTEGAEESVIQQKQKAAQEMDERLAEFIQQYSWAFLQGVAKGKLTAYFERYHS